MDGKKTKQEKIVEEDDKTKVEAIRQELGQIMDDTCNSTNYLEIEKRIAKVRIELNLK